MEQSNNYSSQELSDSGAATSTSQAPDPKVETKSVTISEMLSTTLLATLAATAFIPYDFYHRSVTPWGFGSCIGIWILFSVMAYIPMFLLLNKILGWIPSNGGGYYDSNLDRMRVDSCDTRDIQRSLDKLVQIETTNYYDRITGQFQGKK